MADSAGGGTSAPGPHDSFRTGDGKEDVKRRRFGDRSLLTVAVAANADRTYEQQLEQRVKQILKTVDGVGTVDVMIVLKSSEEKVLRVDKNTSSSSTEEQDSGGGTRKSSSAEQQESTILTGTGENTAPIVEKEIRPEIEGIIISAQGGGSPTVKAEISGAMEALFDLPPHKIKVLKRVE